MLYPANWLDPLIVAAMAGTWLPDWAMLAGSACLQLLTELSPLPSVCVCVSHFPLPGREIRARFILYKKSGGKIQNLFNSHEKEGNTVRINSPLN